MQIAASRGAPIIVDLFLPVDHFNIFFAAALGLDPPVNAIGEAMSLSQAALSCLNAEL